MADDEEAVEHAERNRGDGEEVHRSDGFSMIAQKGEPTFGRARDLLGACRIQRKSSLRDIKENRASKARRECVVRTPGPVLDHHTEVESRTSLEILLLPVTRRALEITRQ